MASGSGPGLAFHPYHVALSLSLPPKHPASTGLSLISQTLYSGDLMELVAFQSTILGNCLHLRAESCLFCSLPSPLRVMKRNVERPLPWHVIVYWMSLYLITSGIFLNICHSSLGFRLEQAQKKIYDYAAMSEEMGIPEYSPYENIYEDTNFTRLTPDSTYEM